MEEEIQNQIEDLPALARRLGNRSRHWSVDPSRMIFTGSGDSFAAALFAHSLAKGRASVEDPYELYLNPERLQGKILFLISVSGRTRTNVRLAKRVGHVAKRRVAITANPTSPLAKACDEVIELEYRSAGTFTAGTIGFTSNLLAVASAAGRLTRVLDLTDMERRAAAWSEKVRIARDGVLFFIGSGISYALAAYGAFKVHEVLGLRAEYQYPEQFGHAQLFSVRRTSDDVICIALGPDERTRQVFLALRRNGFQANLLESDIGDPVSAGLQIAFHLQHLALGLARRTGLRECAFLRDEARLRLSSRLIY